MASTKATAVAFLAIFMVLCAANADFSCCTDNRIGSCITVSTDDNARCDSMCDSNCFMDGSTGSASFNTIGITAPNLRTGGVVLVS
ncbi:hypothetical protein MKW94_014474 [Papaver nudicaule]|uniref:Uncharacterized protein n=1 Tax=Papaver nudicaule TaxID=74823 RepID=A0AA41VCH5_PAPNU|nr:hypothetical protein [Papaver nudicaule]